MYSLIFCLFFGAVFSSLYHVGPDMKWNSPQKAYYAAVQEADPSGSVIMLMPGVYSYGTEQFDITVPNIVFRGASNTPNIVIFTADNTNGGIHIDYPVNALNNFVSFEGITFGLPGNSNGFLLNLTGGQVVLSQCAVSDSNFRASVGGNGFSIFASVGSTFNGLPPNSLITTVDSNTVIFLERNHITQLGNGVPVSPGGYLIDMSNGIGECRTVSNHIVFGAYDAVMKTPESGFDGEGQIVLNDDIIIVNDGGSAPLIKQGGGSYTCIIKGAHFYLQGGICSIMSNSSSDESHTISIFSSTISSKNTLFYSGEDVTILGLNTVLVFNSNLAVENSNLFVNITSMMETDKLELVITGTNLKTQGTYNSVCARGPSNKFATVSVSHSSVIGGGNLFEGFVYYSGVPL